MNDKQAAGGTNEVQGTGWGKEALVFLGALTAMDLQHCDWE